MNTLQFTYAWQGHLIDRSLFEKEHETVLWVAFLLRRSIKYRDFL